ncbi:MULTISPECIES: hypothetical protein [Streptomyces]|uniref:Lipoprotein n=2 Tax=Streptomyces TaxID=1883 RepID=A0ABU2RFG3_9ACTN|nr:MULTISPECIES: hypothetical protein [unclassified Streptomyces]MBK3595753.1 hypothetical protein [Streptomyces sp. MBT51]MDT0426679.1 hypothetical protein [Streptomyces sp. DSM 41770]HBF79667.1 hypothetical protein [Streptomyces sp.]
MSRTKRAAVAAVVVALGATGCGQSDNGAVAGTGAPVSASPRPTGTGPMTKDIARNDLDTAAADAGAPESEPAFAGTNDDAPAGSLRACGVMYKWFGTEDAPADMARFDKMVDELRERDWQQSGDRRERRYDSGVVHEAVVVLEQRGWTTVVEYMEMTHGGDITMNSFDTACAKKNL